MRPLLALALAAIVAACGPGKRSPPPDGGDTGADGGAQPTGSDQPAGGGGEQGGGDQPSGGGAGNGGAPPESGGGGSGDGGAPPDSGSGGASGGGGSGGGASFPVKSPDGTVTVDRVDANAECDGLMPTSAPAAIAAAPAGDEASCGFGISEGGGHVGVQVGHRQTLSTWQVLSPAGTAERTFGVAFNGSSVAAARPFVFPQPDGWVVATTTTFTPGPVVQVDVSGLFPDGAPRGGATRVTPADGHLLSWMLVEDPHGGAAFVRTGNPPSGPDCEVALSRFDAAGRLRAPAATFSGHASTCVALAAVSQGGEALVVEKADAAAWLHWIAADGTPAVAPASAGGFAAVFTSGQPVALAPLLDGSIAAREGPVWTRTFPHLGDRAEPAPGWLAARPGFTFRNTRGDRGYALLPPGADSPDCTQRIEVLAASGRLCGTVTLSDPGGACHTRDVDQGWDGTVVQQSARTACAWRWWPRLLGE